MNSDALAKVPAVTAGFWLIKILATTLGETGGDAVSMSMGLGYIVGTAIFMAIFVVTVALQIASRGFHPLLYWLTIIASTTVGTTLADFADRSLGFGYPGGTTLLFALLLASLLTWHRILGSINIRSVNKPLPEFFYWMTIMFSQTLGTALGDWTADTAGLGYLGAAVIFGALLLLILALFLFTRMSRTLLFWVAFVLTRPLGAVIGDYLDKPVAEGGLDLSRYTATIALFALILVCVLLIPQRAARQAH